MQRETRRFVEQFDIPSLSVLEISGVNWRHLPFKFHFGTSYPSYDVCKGIVSTAREDYPKNFDLIFVEQVLEHVVSPVRAIQHVHMMLKPGGYLVVSTPFLLRLHGAPDDFWRWSENGLRLLLNEGGFKTENIQTSSWGNQACVAANLKDWAEYEPDVHSLENEPDHPVVVWAFARK